MFLRSFYHDHEESAFAEMSLPLEVLHTRIVCCKIPITLKMQGRDSECYGLISSIVLRSCYHQPMKALVIVASLGLTLSAYSQKSADKPPGVLLHENGQRGTLRVILAGRDGQPARHIGVMVLWSCPQTCPIVVSSMMTNSVGEFQIDPISTGKYLVCADSEVDSSGPCFMDVAAASCTVEITPQNPKVELHMQIPERGMMRDKQALCRKIAGSSH